MVSVTERIKEVKQPYGGYLRPRDMEKIVLSDGYELNPVENIHPSITGIVVDYLFRYYINNDAAESFKISILGAWNVGQIDQVIDLIANIGELNSTTIKSACKLAGYDIAYRMGPEYFKGIDHIQPDDVTIENIKILIKRCLAFTANYGPITSDGFTFEGGYSSKITAGDGDFLTESVLWDLKTSRNKPTSRDTLQLLVYYLMGKKTTHVEFQAIDEVAIFNPRRHAIYYRKMIEVSDEVCLEVMQDVIGYV